MPITLRRKTIFDLKDMSHKCRQVHKLLLVSLTGVYLFTVGFHEIQQLFKNLCSDCLISR